MKLNERAGPGSGEGIKVGKGGPALLTPAFLPSNSPIFPLYIYKSAFFKILLGFF